MAPGIDPGLAKPLFGLDGGEGFIRQLDWQVGFLMGPAFAIFYTIFGIPFGRMADRVSRKGLIAFGLTVWSLMTAA